MIASATNTRRAAIPLLLAYSGLILSPLFVLAILRPETDHGFVYTIGKNLALVGFAMFAMQFILSARLKWIERPFGLNLLFSFHKTMAVVASLLVLSHPLLLMIGGGKRSLVFGPDVNWHIWLGRIALVILLFHVLLSSLRLIIRLNYETWRTVHNVVALVFLPLAFLHSWKAGGDLQLPAMRVLWVMLFGAAIIAYFWHRVARPFALRRAPYTVNEVRKEAEGGRASLEQTISGVARRTGPPRRGNGDETLRAAISGPRVLRVRSPRRHEPVDQGAAACRRAAASHPF